MSLVDRLAEKVSGSRRVSGCPVERFYGHSKVAIDGCGGNSWGLFDSGGFGRDVARPEQLVDRQGEAKCPTDSLYPPTAGLAQPARSLEPAEDFFHSSALALADGVATMLVMMLRLRAKCPGG